MTSRVSRRLLQTVKRGSRYYSQALVEKTTDNALKVTKLPNLTVATLETNSPICRLGAVVGVGSRYEQPFEAGLSHFLRQAATLTNVDFKEHFMTGLINHFGGDISCTGTREHLFYELTFLKSKNENYEMENFLQSILTKPAFFKWHLKNLVNPLEFDVAMALSTPEITMMEMVHSTAYRSTLGNSLYMPMNMIGKYSQSDVQEFFKKFYVNKNICLVGLNIDQDVLTSMARLYELKEGEPPVKQKAVYHGGEMWQQMDCPMAYATVVTEGPSAADTKAVLVAAVLQNVMGTGPHLKYSANNCNSRLTKAIQAAAKEPFTVSGVNINYSDSGLFGFTTMSQPEEMQAILKAAFKTFAGLTKTGVTKEELQGAKNRTKASVLMSLESQDVQWRLMAEQVATTGQFTPIGELMDMVDSITVEDVNNMAKKVVNGKPTVVAVGNLHSVPSIDELLK